MLKSEIFSISKKKISDFNIWKNKIIKNMKKHLIKNHIFRVENRRFRGDDDSTLFEAWRPIAFFDESPAIASLGIFTIFALSAR